ncbi:MAG TPA: ATP phosphoribosyltransferase regulatory subunit [Stellaceae bacterium]|nr:ATP phosphoribosyltransferase regulatory subunit [Stellaceae bacterium]
MNEPLHPALLPLGLRDLLPPDAASEALVVDRMMAALESHGYQRVKPPLVEFEESLLSGPGAAMAQETFRLMDPVSQRMIGIRADMTPQVARIAATRLRNAPRPLRLCYAGQVLRVKGGQLRPERQIGQVGAELIGADGAAADAEAIALAAEALAGLGIAGLSVDLTLPRLIPAICDSLGVVCNSLGIGRGIGGADIEAIRAALDHKDAAKLAEIGGVAAPLLGELLAAAGPAEMALAALAPLGLPPAAAAERTRLVEVVTLLGTVAPDLRITVDPVESRGFQYDTGISFSFFARAGRAELGRGGRYVAGNGNLEGTGPEPATGFTLYTDTVLAVVPTPEAPRRLYLPAGVPLATGRRLRAEGWVTIAGLAAVSDVAAEARRLDCGHAWIDGKVVAL